MKKDLANLLLLYRKWRKRNIRLLKKIAVSAFFCTKSNIYFINRKMLEDLAFLWMTELTFSCISMVFEICFTSVLHGVWHLWTGIPAQDDCNTYQNSSAFLGFASEIAFLSPYKFSIGLRSGDWAAHSITLILLVWNQDAAHLPVCLGFLSCWNTYFKDISSSAEGKITSKHFNVLKLINDPCNAINWY